LRWHGTAWRQVRAPSGAASELTAVTAASGPNAWAVGSGPHVLHWDGTAWTRVRRPGFAGGGLYRETRRWRRTRGRSAPASPAARGEARSTCGTSVAATSGTCHDPAA